MLRPVSIMETCRPPRTRSCSSASIWRSDLLTICRSGS